MILSSVKEIFCHGCMLKSEKDCPCKGLRMANEKVLEEVQRYLNGEKSIETEELLPFLGNSFK